MFTNIFSSSISSISMSSLFISMIISLILGFIIAYSHKLTAKYTKGFLVTVSILPFLVQMIIILVNGNLGTGVAIMGAFSLVRFRSLPGTAKEILTVFFSMTIGLAVGTGYVIYASIGCFIGCLFMVLYDKFNLFNPRLDEKVITITIAEDLDYNEVFNNVFNKYTKKVELQKVKTIDMGSLFQLKYYVTLKNIKDEKKFIDDLRICNGNLKIIMSHSILDSEL